MPAASFTSGVPSGYLPLTLVAREINRPLSTIRSWIEHGHVSYTRVYRTLFVNVEEAKRLATYAITRNRVKKMVIPEPPAPVLNTMKPRPKEVQLPLTLSEKADIITLPAPKHTPDDQLVKALWSISGRIDDAVTELREMVGLSVHLHDIALILGRIEINMARLANAWEKE